jgi:hypothetical protein
MRLAETNPHRLCAASLPCKYNHHWTPIKGSRRASAAASLPNSENRSTAYPPSPGPATLTQPPPAATKLYHMVLLARLDAFAEQLPDWPRHSRQKGSFRLPCRPPDQPPHERTSGAKYKWRPPNPAHTHPDRARPAGPRAAPRLKP